MKPVPVFLALAIPAMIASAWMFAPPGTILLSLSFGALLIALSAIDIATFRLPDPLTFTILLFGVIMVALTRPDLWAHHLLGAVIGYTALVGLEITYKRLRKRDGLGRGDAKLLGAIGIWVAWPGLAPVMLVASFSALVAILTARLAIRHTITADMPVAFGPWTALGGWVVWLATPHLALLQIG